jgi:hypothetical protein
MSGVFYPADASATAASGSGAQMVASTYMMAEAVDGYNETVVATKPALLSSMEAYNARTGGVRIAFYDKATAPVVPSDTPKWTVYLPPLAATARDYPRGIQFATGLSLAIIPDDATGLMAGDVQSLNLGYSA